MLHGHQLQKIILFEETQSSFMQSSFNLSNLSDPVPYLSDPPPRLRYLLRLFPFYQNSV